METKNREKLLMIWPRARWSALWLLYVLVFGPLIDSWHSRSAEIAKLKKEIAKRQNARPAKIHHPRPLG